MTIKAGSGLHFTKMLVLALLMACTGARAAAINTGVEKLLWPAVIIASPFLIVHELVFGSDEGSMRSAEKDADRILEKTPGSIPVTGLYTGSVDLRWALYGMLVVSRLQFVEINSAGSGWLLSQSTEPEALIPLAEQHPYIRLALGSQGDPACLSWKISNDDWTANPPVRPRTCLLIKFVDELQSDLALSVDTSELRHRELRWDLVDRATGNKRLSLPFWQSQIEGKPLNVSAIYRAAHEAQPFSRVIKKLLPTAMPVGQDGRPYSMGWIDNDAIWLSELGVGTTSISASFRSPAVDWAAVAQDPRNERWLQAYDRAAATGMPVILNNSLLVLPQQDQIRRACIAPSRSGFCDFAKNFVSEAGVLTVRDNPAYQDPEFLRKPGVPFRAQPLSVTLMGRKPEGALMWFVDITPAELPDSVRQCNDFSLGCYFYPRQATTVNQEVIIRGVFGARHDPTSRQLPRDEFELVVPLSQLPPVARSRPPGMN